MLKFHSILLYLHCLNEAASFHTSFTDFYLESVKILHSKTSFLHGNASLKRSGHEHPKLFIEVDLSDAITNYDTDVKIYYSPLGNQRFMLMPYKVERQSFCEALQFKQVQQIAQSIHNFSNVPLPDTDRNVPYCELFTIGRYMVHDFEVDKSIFPRFTPTGRFRWVGFAYKKGKKEIVQAIEFIAAFI